MDPYPWLVFTHATAIFLFFILHGVSMAVAFRLTTETEPDRVRALLDVSGASLVPSYVLILIGLAAGIAVGFVGEWWGQLWIWISLALFLIVGFAMTPMAAGRLRALRVAAGQPVRGGTPESEPQENTAEMARILESWNPVPTAILGYGALLVILWLMFFKPF